MTLEDKTIDEIIAKLERNSFQYASAGDVRRLVQEIHTLRAMKNHPRAHANLLHVPDFDHKDKGGND